MKKIAPRDLGLFLAAFVVGVILGYAAFGPGKARATAGIKPIEPTAHAAASPPAPELPGKGTAASGEVAVTKSKAALIAEQINHPKHLEHAAEVWLPESVLTSFSWHLGDVSGKFNLSTEAQRALEITPEQKAAIQSLTNKFVEMIRNAELKHAQIESNTGDSLILHFPRESPMTAEVDRLRENLAGVIGEDKARIMFPRLLEELQYMSSLITGTERFIAVKLVGESGVEVSVSEDKSGLNSWKNYIPESLKHLVHIAEDNLKKR